MESADERAPSTAIVLHADSVRARLRAERRMKIRAARNGAPLPATREQNLVLLGIRRGIFPNPYTRPTKSDDPIAFLAWPGQMPNGLRTFACSECHSLLVLRRDGGTFPCGWCVAERDDVREAEAHARYMETRPPRHDDLNTQSPPSSLRPWVLAAFVLMLLTAAAAWLDKQHRDDAREAAAQELH